VSVSILVFLQSVECLLVPHSVRSVFYVSLYAPLSSRVSPLSVSTSHSTVCWFSATMSTAVFYNVSNVSQYLTRYLLGFVCYHALCSLLHSLHCLLVPYIIASLFQCHYVHYCFLYSLHDLSIPHTIPSFFLCQYVVCSLLQSVCSLAETYIETSIGSLSPCPGLSSTISPPSVSSSHRTVCWSFVTVSTTVLYTLSSACQYLPLYRLVFFSVTMSASVFYSLSAVFSFLTLYRLVVLFHHAHLCLPLSVQCLSVHHNIPSYGSVLLCHLLSFAVSPKSYNTSICTVRSLCLFCVTMSTAVFYIFFHCLSVHHLVPSVFLCFCVHCCLLPSVLYLSVRDTEVSVVSVSLCPLLSSTLCPLSVSTSHFSFCWLFQYYYRHLQFLPCISVPQSIRFFVLCHYVNWCLLQSLLCLQNLTLYRVLFLSHYVHSCLLQSLQCMSVPHTVSSVILCLYVQCSLLQSFQCLLLRQTVPSLFMLHYDHCCLLQSVPCLSVPHTVPSV